MRSLKTIVTALISFVLLFFIVQAENDHAQSTLFNIPSTDVVAKKSVYAEFDFLSHLDDYKNGGFQTYVPRIVVGLGKKTEAGLNVAFTKAATPQPVELQPNIKYQFYQNEENGISASAGTVLYAPINRRGGTDTFGMIYSIVSKQTRGKYGPRITGGGYGLVGRKKGNGARGGAIIGYEQPLASKVKFVSDWFSGNNRFGYVTPGLAITTSKTSALYAGYSIGNVDGKSNALFIYYGITF